MVVGESWVRVSHRRAPRIIETFEGYVTDILGSRAIGDGAPGPQAFLVDQNPNWVTPAHFHLEDQFQVVTAGAGSIGKHPVVPLSVHYASAESGYGPINAGAEGVSYLTLRAMHDTGAWYLHKPGTREKMRAGLAKLQAYGAPQSAVDNDSLAVLPAVSVEPLIAPRENGLAAHLLRMPPGGETIFAAEHAHGGRYYIVTHGALTIGASSLDALGVGFSSPDETPALRAGSAGAAVLVLQFALAALHRSAKGTS